MMSFPLGKPIFVMLLIAAASGLAVLQQRQPPRKDLVVWVFARPHAQTYLEVIPEFERQTGLSVDLQLLSSRALDTRLNSMFLSGLEGPEVPDLVEIEIGAVGRYFRPPADRVGFAPLDEFLTRGGWDQRVLASRFAPWSKHGVVFGLPHDVHPVTITYRDDLFRQAGVDLSQARTWKQFHEMCLQFRDYWHARGYGSRHAMELPEASADYLTAMLLQRGVNLVDDEGRSHLDDPRVAEAMAFYARMRVGPRQVATESTGGSAAWVRDLVEGHICALITPDWRVANIKTFAPDLAGRMRMMPLPRFEDGDTPTSTWGGTMLGIPRASPNREAAWKLAEFLYLSRQGLEARRKFTSILAPIMEDWADPAWDRPDAYYGGQKIDALYIGLAPQIPRRIVTPLTGVATTHLSVVLSRAVSYIRDGRPADGLEETCRQWLAEANEDLARRAEHLRFD